MRNSTAFVSLIAVIGILTFSLDAFAQRCRSGSCGGNRSGNFGRSSGSSLNKSAFTQRQLGTNARELNLLFSPIARPGDIDLNANIILPAGVAFTKSGDEFDTRFNLGAAYGISDDLEIGGHLIGTEFNGDFRDPLLWTLFTFGEQDTDYGVRLATRLPFSDGSDVNVHFATPTKIGFDGGMMDLAIAFDIVFAEEVNTLFSVPFRLAFNLTNELFLGAQSALVMPDFDADFLVMPLGFFFGYSIIQDNKPFIDIGAAFNFPLFLGPDLETGEGKAILTDIYEIGIGLDFAHRF